MVIDSHRRRAVVRAVREVGAVIHVAGKRRVEARPAHWHRTAPHAPVGGHPHALTVGARHGDDWRRLASRGGNDAAFPNARRRSSRRRRRGAGRPRGWAGRAGARSYARIITATAAAGGQCKAGGEECQDRKS